MYVYKRSYPNTIEVYIVLQKEVEQREPWYTILIEI